MKFSKGQVLKVRDDLYTMAVDGVFNLWTDMCKFAGEEVVISDARETQWGDRYEIVGSPRCWTEECFVEIKKVKEVNRLAKVGEWIKVLSDGVWQGNGYKKDEIYQVDDNYHNGNAYFHILKPDERMFTIDEYVVLENYQPDSKPEEPKPFIKAKVGDKIQVVKSGVYHTPKLKIGDIHEVNGYMWCGDGVTTPSNVFKDEDEEYIIIEEASQKTPLSEYTIQEISAELLRRYGDAK